MMRRLRSLVAALFLASAPGPAEAGPLAAAIGGIISSISTAFAAGGFFTTFLGRLILSVGLSALQAALMQVKKPTEPGIKTKVTQTGGMNPQAFPLLKYMTAGTHVCPPMSHSGTTSEEITGVPNAYLTYVILLSDVPGCALFRVLVNGQYIPLGGVAHPAYGFPATGDHAGHLWVKYYNGTQTAADPMLLDKYSTYPERPWSADMIGRGSAYAIVTFGYNREKFPGMPRVSFEMSGIPLYDPRKDTSVGGSGAHRWTNKATWEISVNPVVGIYNVMRGIEMPDGSVYGGGQNIPGTDLPLATWFAAMNECDGAADDGDGGIEAQFRAGLEVRVSEEPADAIGELLKACMGQMADIGGIWKIRCGAPGISVVSISDADIVISQDQTFHPFPNFASSYNGAQASYPEPENGWQPKDAPPYYNATYEAADAGERLVADLNLVAVPYGAQVRRIMFAAVEEERRFRRHQLTLPPDYAELEPLDSVAWTSSQNGYTAKVFELSGVTEDPMTGLIRLITRERDSADFSYPVLAAPAPISISPVIPPPQTVPGFAVSGASVPDSGGNDRRPAVLLTWDTNLADVRGILWQVRLQSSGVTIALGSTQDVEAGQLLVGEGILASTVYEVQAKCVVDRPSNWTSWLPATTPATLITRPDIEDGAVSDQFQTIVLGPLTKNPYFGGTDLATVDMGLIGPGQIWRRGVHFEARTHGAVQEVVIAVQTRNAKLGGGLGAWTTQSTWTITDTAWDLYTDQGGLVGEYDDFEYRLRTISLPPSMDDSFEYIRDIYLTLARVTK